MKAMTKHDIDAVSVAFGAVFLMIVGWWLVVRSIDIIVPGFGWFLGGVLVVLGVLGVFATLRSERHKEPTGAAPPRTGED